MSDQDRQDNARVGLEDAVLRALEAGFNAEDVRREVDYALETAEDE